ncbi:MAG: RNA-binding S4 domain-containing protein [Bacilli bacterium]|jgi:ribosomal 50S subunit-recycling heat shock protein|nr:RNA-binding S4 domain-containing protein [Bacilli bacterium]MDD3348524.1 RNA-binding S4 domain-containing protein [Bacilli bacterium]MDD4056828.1 RNA-binding S4 domain-containing protein [Bacilli bacterium]MDY0208829.1 RNA-binding S4 domain-containing protein [Bacilli bacterium]
MRVDKFLKVSRLIKRRAVAKEASDSDKITVNGKIAKPSTILKIGDQLEINYFKKKLVVIVRALTTSTKKEDADAMYDVVEVIDN